MSDEVKEVVEGMGKAFEEFKATNNQRLEELEKKGSVDPLIDEKLQKIEADMDKFEDANQKLTVQAQESKTMNEKLDRLETMVKRPFYAESIQEQKDQAHKSFYKYLQKGKEGMEDVEVKALSVSNDTGAGFLAPTESVNELIKTVTEISP